MLTILDRFWQCMSELASSSSTYVSLKVEAFESEDVLLYRLRMVSLPMSRPPSAPSVFMMSPVEASKLSSSSFVTWREASMVSWKKSGVAWYDWAAA